MDLDESEITDLARFFSRRFPGYEQRSYIAGQAGLASGAQLAGDPRDVWKDIIRTALEAENLPELARIAAQQRPADENLRHLVKALESGRLGLSGRLRLLLGLSLLVSLVVLLFFVLGRRSHVSTGTPAPAADSPPAVARANPGASVEFPATAPSGEEAPAAPEPLPAEQPSGPAPATAPSEEAPAALEPPPAGQPPGSTGSMLAKAESPHEDPSPSAMSSEPPASHDPAVAASNTVGQGTEASEPALPPAQAMPRPDATGGELVEGRCGGRRGQLIGYWYAGSTAPWGPGDTYTVWGGANVRKMFPARENHWNTRSELICTLKNGDKVLVRDAPIAVDGGAYWVPLYAGDLLTP